MNHTRHPEPPQVNTSIQGGLVATVVAGLLASVCCVGPLILVVLGVGGAWVADLTALDPIRPWLTGATLVLLGFAHYRYWRRRWQTARDCPPHAGRQALWLWLASFVVLGLLAAPYVLPSLMLPSLPHTTQEAP
ncbi:MAG: mercuric transporter MerT family protein [Acidiferrobacteraceae bacterium]